MSEQVHVLSKSVGRKCERIVSIEIREDTAQPSVPSLPFLPYVPFSEAKHAAPRRNKYSCYLGILSVLSWSEIAPVRTHWGALQPARQAVTPCFPNTHTAASMFREGM